MRGAEHSFGWRIFSHEGCVYNGKYSVSRKLYSRGIFSNICRGVSVNIFVKYLSLYVFCCWNCCLKSEAFYIRRWTHPHWHYYFSSKHVGIACILNVIAKWFCFYQSVSDHLMEALSVCHWQMCPFMEERKKNTLILFPSLCVFKHTHV